MSTLSAFLVLYTIVSLIYTELIFKIISFKSSRISVNTKLSVTDIIKNILDDQKLYNVSIRRSSNTETIKSFYLENDNTIMISAEDSTVGSVAAAIHECGHAIQYNKTHLSLAIIRLRDKLRKFYLLDILSPFAVGFFAAFCMPLCIVSCVFMIKLVARVVVEFLVEVDANLRVQKYIRKYVSDKLERKEIRKFLRACSVTYLSTIS